MNTQIEICCGSYYDAQQAEAGGAKRIELNTECSNTALNKGTYKAMRYDDDTSPRGRISLSFTGL